MSEYYSQLSDKLVRINDHNFQKVVQYPVVNGEIMGRGRIPAPPTFSSGLPPLSLPLIPPEEYDERIEEMERTKTTISHLCRHAKLPCKDQGRTNYCWINAPVHQIEIVRVVQGQPMVILSPASAGAPIKNFRNVGGWGTEGMRFLAEKGCCPVEKWPANAIDRRYYTEENRQLALQYRAEGWEELRPRSVPELFTCLLNRKPVGVGYNWWAHEVTACAVVILPRSLRPKRPFSKEPHVVEAFEALGDGKYALEIRNSWSMSWGDEGFGLLEGSRLIPDDAVVLQSTTPS